MNSLLNLVSIASGIIGLVGAGFGAIAFQRSAAKKEYAAERDFRELHREIELLRNAVTDQNRLIEELFSRIAQRQDQQAIALAEIKTYVMARLGENSMGVAIQRNEYPD